jgi:hypothetical protein
MTSEIEVFDGEFQKNIEDSYSDTFPLSSAPNSCSESIQNQPGIYICIQEFRAKDCIGCKVGDLIKITQVFNDTTALGFNLTTLQTGLVCLDFFIEMAAEMLIDLAKNASTKPSQISRPAQPFYRPKRISVNPFMTHCIQTDDLNAPPKAVQSEKR